MIKTALSTLVAIVVFASFTVQTTNAQCGIYFKPGYRAVGKTAAGAFFGSPFALNDWTGDGRLDYWNFRQTQIAGPVEIIIYPALPTGYWNWDAPIVYTTGIPAGAHTQTSGQLILDFDGDGLKDIMLTANNGSGPRLRTIYRNLGNGSLQTMAATPEPGTSSAFMRPIGWFDINGDNKLDWVYAIDPTGSNPDTLNYSIQNADGSFGPDTVIFTGTAENEFTNSTRIAGDFDGDGKIDIAYLTISSPDRRIRIVKNMGNSTFVTSSPMTMVSETSGSQARDFNNDGRDDVLTIGSGQFVVYYGQSNGTFTPMQFTARNNPSAPVLFIADLNGDGRLDILNSGPQDYEVFLGDPSVGFTNQYYPRRFRPNTFQFTLADFSGDGKADVLDLQTETKNYFNEEVVTIDSGTCESRGRTRAMNFDGEITANDIATWNSATGEWRTTQGNWPAGGNLATISYNWGTAGDVPAPGDFDGDLKTDYSVYRSSEGKWYMFLSATSSWSVFRFGLPGDIPVPGDYDGGGTTDIAVFRPDDGNWYVWFSETQQFLAVHWGANGDRPVPADYDGDLKTDLAVFRPSTGDWYYTKSSDSGYGITHWGTTGDVPVPADYDGDGRADLTVFRSGVWFILRSSNGVYQPVNFGTTGDIPIPFLERGDIAWPVVYRPSNSRWYSSKWIFGVVVTPGGTPVNFGLPNN